MTKRDPSKHKAVSMLGDLYLFESCRLVDKAAYYAKNALQLKPDNTRIIYELWIKECRFGFEATRKDYGENIELPTISKEEMALLNIKLGKSKRNEKDGNVIHKIGVGYRRTQPPVWLTGG